MQYVKDRTGRFPERPHYEPKELDVLFERIVIDFLNPRYGKIEFPITTSDLTVLIECDVKDLDVYADLTEYGVGVEGVTEFIPGQKPKVRIAEGLASSEAYENRYRTTLTHEYGHVKLHGYLFDIENTQTNLFESANKKGVIACKRDTMISAKQTDWMEWQAGYACGAILMPATYVRKVLEPYQKEMAIYGPVPASSAEGQAMIERVIKEFQVSRDAARVRLSVLQILGNVPVTEALLG